MASPLPLPVNSTNVRPNHGRAAQITALPGDASRTLGLALATWGSAVALGATDGVFARLGIEVQLALAAFALGFALATYALDAEIRRTVDGMPPRVLALAALGVDAALWVAFGPEDGAASFAAGPAALLAYFAAPLAGVAHVALARGLGWARLRSRAARSPGARRAAT